MKTIYNIYMLSVFFFYSLADAKDKTNLKLSDLHPKAGEKIMMIYSPPASFKGDYSGINSVVYFIDNKKEPAVVVNLHRRGNCLLGKFLIPKESKAFLIKFSKGKMVDNNANEGYIYMIEKYGRPVNGAYAAKAFLLSSGIGSILAQIKSDAREGVRLYQKEFSKYPENKGKFSAQYYSLLCSLPEYKDEVNEKILTLRQSNVEKDLLFAANLLEINNDHIAADSIREVARLKFPNGESKRREEESLLTKEKDPFKKEVLFEAYIKQFADFPDLKHKVDDLKLQLATAYLEIGNLDGFRRFESQLKNKSGLIRTLNNVAYSWAEKDIRLSDAELLSKQSLGLLRRKINHPTGEMFTPSAAIKLKSQHTYDEYADTYAYILYKIGKYAKAIAIEQVVINHNMIVDATLYEHYMQMLNATKAYRKTLEFAEKAILLNGGTDIIKWELKIAYQGLNGSNNGYNQYLAKLEAKSQGTTIKDMEKTMIDQASPPFALKDLTGKVVSLEDFKGKVVVLDFWASWCIPCKASFPGMQLAVDRYSNDPNVVFLFIDTYEKSDNYVSEVKKYINDHKYNFHVLLDDQNELGKRERVVTEYGVDGIPTKFVIDSNGHIRFKYVGYSGTAEKLLAEIVDMVELTKNK